MDYYHLKWQTNIILLFVLSHLCPSTVKERINETNGHIFKQRETISHCKLPGAKFPTFRNAHPASDDPLFRIKITWASHLSCLSLAILVSWKQTGEIRKKEIIEFPFPRGTALAALLTWRLNKLKLTLLHSGASRRINKFFLLFFPEGKSRYMMWYSRSND